MIVCVCKQVSDRQIRADMAAGGCTMRALRECYGLGTQCGKCCKHAREILRESGGEREVTFSLMPFAVA